MLENPITNSSFKIKNLNEGAYELTIQFFDENGPLSEKKFTFYQNDSVEEGKIVDVFTKNAKCSESLLKNLFQQKDISQVENAKEILKKINYDLSVGCCCL